MEKKKIIPIITIVFILIIGIVWFAFYKNNNKIVSTITLDINPSIEINLNKKDKVLSVVALNEDAKDIISNRLKGKSLDDTIKTITINVIDKGYIDNNYVAIILYTKGNIQSDKLENTIRDYFGQKQVGADIIVVKEITKEDEKIAKKYNISPAKASYIKSIAKDIENLDIEDFSKKSVSEIRDTKETGNYCPSGYTLEGSWCFKEIGKKEPKRGEVCPYGYLEYNGICYEETGIEDTGIISCPDEYTLKDGLCIRNYSVDAIGVNYTCSTGMVKTKGEVGMTDKNAGDSKDPVCVDSNVTYAVSVCELPASDPTERMSYGGVCYWHRAPVIESGCPGKIQVNGECWDDASNIYLCPNGNNANTRTKGEPCYTVLNGVTPTASSYKCENKDMTLEGNKCVGIEKVGVIQERNCPNGTTMVNDDRCINMDKSTSKTKGLICDEDNTRLKNDDCIVYEQIEALHN